MTDEKTQIEEYPELEVPSKPTTNDKNRLDNNRMKRKTGYNSTLINWRFIG